MAADEDPTPEVPPALGRVVAFVNTRAMTEDDPVAREDLGDPEALDAWTRSMPHRPVGWTAAGPVDLEIAHAVREGLRGLAARHNDCAEEADEAAVTRMAGFVALLPLRVDVLDPELAIVPWEAGSARATLAWLLTDVLAARVAGTWPRVKACRDPFCREAFYDSSRNRSRTWCAMDVCGSRAKRRTFVARRRADAH